MPICGCAPATPRRSAKRGEPTLPSTIGLELQTNPFMRSDANAVRDAAIAHAGAPAIRSRTDVFATLRAWKNDFR